MEKTIRVTGKGKLSVKPDSIRLNLKLVGVKETYENTLKLSTEEVEILKNCIESIGFKRTDLKTLSFHVDTKYESFRDQNNDWKQRFEGYEFQHNMKIDFDSDNKLLGRVLFELAKCPIKPEFRIQYTIKDPEFAKNELLAKAMADSKIKAEILSIAAGVQLGDIINIDYSWGEIEFLSRPVDRLMEASICTSADVCSYEIDIEPDDIDVTDTVTLIWNIK